MDKNSKEYKEYLRELDYIPTRRKNEIISLVNYKTPKDKIIFEAHIEELFYDSLIREAEEMQEKHGIWPIFELYEIDYDDPILDIYSQESIDRHKEERRRRMQKENDGEST